MINYSVSWTPADGAPTPSTPPDLLALGIAAHRRGELDQAITHFTEALRARPNRVFAAFGLGVANIDKGMGLISIPFLRRALMLRPDSVPAGEALLYALLRSGRLDDAEMLLADVEARHIPIDTAAWRDRLTRCRDGADPATLGLPAPVLSDVEHEPPDPSLTLQTETPAHAALRVPFARALANHRDGKWHTLIADLNALLEAHPDWGEGMHLRGVTLMAIGRLDPAVSDLQQASRLLPGRSEIQDHLSVALGRLDDLPGVRNAFEQALALDPLRPETWNNAADSAIAQQRDLEAYQYAFQAVRLRSDELAFVLNLGRAAKGIGSLAFARKALLRLLDALPEHAAARRELGEISLLEGRHAEAVAHFEQVLAGAPDDLAVQGSLIFLKNYLGSETQAGICARARRFGELLEKGLPEPATWPAPPDPERRLRVGFVSGDLRTHPVGRFFRTVAEALARSDGLELFAYPTTRQADDLTQRIRAAFDHWTPIPGLSDEEASARIHADRIDILVDLSGHTGRNRLGVFARRPAPVQVTWLGYFGTTGLSRIDYFLAGPLDVPPREECEFVERIWRLPSTRLCFSRPDADVEVAPLPALLATGRSGPITFGCFNNLRKLDDRVVRLWARVLEAVEDSRLFLKTAALASEPVREAIRRRFRDAGLDPARLILEGESPYAEYLGAYARVDIALDPFPYTGGTTSIEALWMGVPVLTLAGDRLLSRQGEGMLRALGLDDWVASDEADYLEKAVGHAGLLDSLKALRAGLRPRLEASALMDAPRFARDLEAVLRGMWVDRCAAANTAIAAPVTGEATPTDPGPF